MKELGQIAWEASESFHEEHAGQRQACGFETALHRTVDGETHLFIRTRGTKR